MAKNIHIAAIIPYVVYPAKMGGQKGIASFYQYLSELLPVTMIAAGNQQPDNFKGAFIPALGTLKFRYANPFLIYRVKKIIEKNKCTHLILEHPYFGWLGIILKRACNIKLVVHSHNIESLRFKSTGKWWWKLLWNYEKFTHQQSDINFFITDEDRQYAIENFRLNDARCFTITYGFEMNRLPSPEEKTAARKKIESIHKINPNEKILLFNGTLSYKPNLDAVDVIVKHINPILQKERNFKYKIIICGKGLPVEYNALHARSSENIIYAGFVDDISVYFKACDIFLNPVTDGGGIKTKLVEALGYNVNGVSTITGAIGIPGNVSGNKLTVTTNDWSAFATAIINTDASLQTPSAFFDHFYWGNIAKKAGDILIDETYKTL